jgi:hypothetical protein
MMCRRANTQFVQGVGQVIKGWDLGILGSEADGIPAMREGGKRTLVRFCDLQLFLAPFCAGHYRRYHEDCRDPFLAFIGLALLSQRAVRALAL